MRSSRNEYVSNSKFKKSLKSRNFELACLVSALREENIKLRKLVAQNNRNTYNLEYAKRLFAKALNSASSLNLIDQSTQTDLSIISLHSWEFKNRSIIILFDKLCT